MQGYWILLIALGIPVGLFLFLKVADLIYGRKPTNLGVHNGKLAPMKETPKGMNSYSDYIFQKMEAFPYLGSKDEAVATMVTILKNLEEFLRITFYELSPQTGYIWARDISLIMRWKDNIEFFF